MGLQTRLCPAQHARVYRPIDRYPAYGQKLHCDAEPATHEPEAAGRAREHDTLLMREAVALHVQQSPRGDGPRSTQRCPWLQLLAPAGSLPLCQQGPSERTRFQGGKRDGRVAYSRAQGGRGRKIASAPWFVGSSLNIAQSESFVLASYLKTGREQQRSSRHARAHICIGRHLGGRVAGGRTHSELSVTATAPSSSVFALRRRLGEFESAYA